jgi:phosphodiesterase/alkaline phosphatase D-like protein
MRSVLLTLLVTLSFMGSALAQSQESAPVNVFRVNDLKIVDGPRVESVTDTTVVIAWSTDVESSAVVQYGTDQNALDQRAVEKWGGQKTGGSVVHRVTIRNLKPGTKYFFLVESGQGWHRSPAVAKSDVQSFTAKAEGYKPAVPVPDTPLIQPDNIVAGPMATNVTDTSAMIWWMSSDSMSGHVVYGKTQLSMDNKLPFKVGEQKSVSLTALEPSTTYFFRVEDTHGKSIADGSFKTEPAGFQNTRFKIVNGPSVEVVGKDSAIISWSTNARSSSVLHFGTDAANLDQTAMAPWGQQLHRVVVKNLKPNTKYYFQVESAQAQGSGLSAKSNIAPFRTVAEGQAAMRNPDWRR